MKQISEMTYQTPVKILRNTFVSCTLLLSFHSFAQSNSNSSTSSTNTTTNSNNYTPTCNDLSRDVTSAIEKINEACRKAGFAGKCYKEALACDEAVVEEEPSTFSQLASAMGGGDQITQMINALTNTSGDEGSKKCPQYNAQDYKERSKDLSKQLKESKEELAKLEKEQITDQEEFTKQSEEIKVELQDLEKQNSEDNMKLDEEERKNLAEFTAGMASANEQMASERINLIAKDAAIRNNLKTRAISLLPYTASNIRFTCDAEKQKQLMAYGNAIAKGGNFLRRASSKASYLADIYAGCTKKLDIERSAMIEKSKGEMELLQQQRRDIEAKLLNIQQSIDLATSQLAEVKASTQKKKDLGLQNLMQKNQNAQEKLTRLYQASQAKNAVSERRIAEVKADIARTNMQIESMGVEPKGKEYTQGDAAGVIDAQLRVLDNLKGSAQDFRPPCQNVMNAIDANKGTYQSGGSGSGTN